ncbi:MAG: pyruvate kinase [Candidatus Roizmanbacteria bacterium]
MNTKLTKIIATIGPVTESEDMIERLIVAGVNIFRFNFKHSSVEWHSERIQRVHKVAEKLGVIVGILVDLQGPEIRILLPDDQMDLKKGELLLLGPEALEKKEKGFSITHPDVIKHLKEGQKLLADDGYFVFHVVKKDGKTYLRSEQDLLMKSRKTLNIPGADFPFPVLVDRDFEGLQLAARNNVDFVGLSFVRTASDLRTMKEEMQKYGVKALAVAKIETQKALDNLDEIIEECDAVMIARGDLGVEQPLEQVPFYQKILIKKCIETGKPVITATQMLQSMITQPMATRAEVSDIANATYDLTDSVMLSGETASGSYPFEAVEMMARTASFNERQFMMDNRYRFEYELNDEGSLICDTAYSLFLQCDELDKDVKAFVVYSHTGKTARMLSRYRPLIPIFAITPEKHVAESLTISFGVTPFVHREIANGKVTQEHIQKTLEDLRMKEYIATGDKVIVLHGDVWSIEGGTSTVKIVTTP